MKKTLATIILTIGIFFLNNATATANTIVEFESENLVARGWTEEKSVWQDEEKSVWGNQESLDTRLQAIDKKFDSKEANLKSIDKKYSDMKKTEEEQKEAVRKQTKKEKDEREYYEQLDNKLKAIDAKYNN